MWWIIIGAVIALIVVIILLIMFTGKTRDLERGATECEGKGGVCTVKKESPKESCPANTLETSTFSCGGNNICCIGIPNKCNDAQDKTTCGKDKKGDPITCEQFGNHFYCPS